MTPVWLDVTRLLERVIVGSLSGIDRVELAYAEHLPPERTRFVVLNRGQSRLAVLPDSAARRFPALVRQGWTNGDPGACRPAALALLAGALFGPEPKGGTYLLLSHRHLHRQMALRRALSRAGSRFLPMVHDLIPLTHPEYVRPPETARHRLRMKTIAALADSVLVNSAATARALADYLPRDVAVGVVPLGTGFTQAAGGPVRATRRGNCADSGGADIPVTQRTGTGPIRCPQPYFVTVGTIEPRKNHLLLLNIWRRMVAQNPDHTPVLVIAGRRGWENENIIDLLDRCPALRHHVVEYNNVPDAILPELIGGARALLMPSFAEGFGLPVAEALTLGTPVLCSDIAALRETGGGVPDYLDPLDALAWYAAILDYADPLSRRRSAQLMRMTDWRPRGWAEHVAAAVDFLDQSNGRPT